LISSSYVAAARLTSGCIDPGSVSPKGCQPESPSFVEATAGALAGGWFEVRVIPRCRAKNPPRYPILSSEFQLDDIMSSNRRMVCLLGCAQVVVLLCSRPPWSRRTMRLRREFIVRNVERQSVGSLEFRHDRDHLF
jgi:hypothetical protein